MVKFFKNLKQKVSGKMFENALMMLANDLKGWQATFDRITKNEPKSRDIHRLNAFYKKLLKVKPNQRNEFTVALIEKYPLMLNKVIAKEVDEPTKKFILEEFKPYFESCISQAMSNPWGTAKRECE
jgi:hypothetical protein